MARRGSSNPRVSVRYSGRGSGNTARPNGGVSRGPTGMQPSKRVGGMMGYRTGQAALSTAGGTKF